MEYFKNKDLRNLPSEIFKDVLYFEGLYKVSNLGRVKSLERLVSHKKSGSIKVKEKILTQFFNKDGYLVARLSKFNKGQGCLVHRLVGMSFIINPENKKTINHIDGDKQNNFIDNLEWNTDSENNLHSFRYLGRKSGTFGKKGKECATSVPIVCINDENVFDSMREAGQYYKIQESEISQICNGKSFSAGKDKLRFCYLNEPVNTGCFTVNYRYKLTPCMELLIIFSNLPIKEKMEKYSELFVLNKQTIRRVIGLNNRLSYIKKFIEKNNKQWV